MEAPYDLLLEWLSERGSGSWEHFREAFDWLRPARARPPWETPGFIARQLSALGHFEIDWASRRWAAAPPVLTLLPSAGAHALLTGGRTRTLVANLETEMGNRQDFFLLDPYPQEFAPSARLLACEVDSDFEGLAEALDLEFAYSVSERLAELLPPIDSYLELAKSQPAPNGYGVQQLDLQTLKWDDVDQHTAPALYRYDVPHGSEFRLVGDKGVYAVDLALGVYAALSRWGESMLKYFPSAVNGELEVPIRAPLPTLQARTAVLCSGLAPKRRGRCLIYVNVPLHIAQSIALSLDQSLHVV